MYKWLRVVALMVAAFAIAVPVAGAAPASPVWERIDITLQSPEPQTVLLVTGQLPEGTPLPARMELAVPAGTSIQWVGEILGGPASEDPAVKYDKTTRGSVDIYAFTLTKSRMAQIEGVINSAGVAETATSFRPTLAWIAWTDLPDVRFIQRLPKGATASNEVSGTSLVDGGPEFDYVIRSFANMKAGDVASMPVTFQAPVSSGAAGTPGGGSGGSEAGTIALILGLAVAGFVAAGVVVSRSRRRRDDDGEELESTLEERVTAESRAESHNVDDSDDAPITDETPGGVRSGSKKWVLTFVVLAVVALGFVFAANKGTTANVVGDTLGRSFGAADACSSVVFSVKPASGVDLRNKGDKLLDAFTGQEAIGQVTLDIAKNTISIGFCDSSQTQEGLASLLEGTGLVTVEGVVPAAQ